MAEQSTAEAPEAGEEPRRTGVDGPVEPADRDQADKADKADQSGPQKPRTRWQRMTHPESEVAFPLLGFFTGVVFFIVGPGLYAALLHKLASDQTASNLFPFVLLFLAVPIGLMVSPRTRRFGAYMLGGLVLAAAAILGAGAIALFFVLRG